MGVIDMGWFREAAQLTAEESVYRAARQGRLGSPFVLEREGVTMASTDKMRTWGRVIPVRWEAKRYELARESAWRRGYVLRDGGSAVGTIRPAGWATRRAVADLPDDLPLPVRMFIMWIVLAMWRRAAQAAS